jgi:hypothetical protein
MDIERLRHLYAALYDETEGSRNAAALTLLRQMKQAGVHPNDLIIEFKGKRHARQDRILSRHEEETTRLRRQLAFFQEHADAKLLRKAARAMEVENRWDDFHRSIGQRLRGFPPGWKAMVKKMVGVSNERFKLWEQGVVRIPDAAFDALRTSPIPEVTRRTKTRKANGKLHQASKSA